MERDIKRAFNRADGSAAGRKSGQQFGQQFSSSASQSVNVSGIQSKMAAAGSIGAKALGGALTVGVAAAGAAVTATLGSALSKGWDRLVSIDDAKFKLKALGNSAEDVQSIMDSALASVKGTAYGLGEAATIAASAVAAGVKPGQELTSYLKLTADAAAVAGTSLQDMGLIINQVRTTGAAYTEDLNQLAGRGIPIYQWLGDAAGVAASDVKKLAADGKISSQMLEQAIAKNIGGAAKTMGQSFSGAVQNAQAALGRLGEALLKPMFQNASGGVGAITSALDGLTAWINSNQGSIISFWQGVGEVSLIAAQQVLQAVGEITVAAGQLVGGVGNIQGAMLKLQSAAARFRGDGDEADRLNAEAEAAFGWGESIQDAGRKMLSTASSLDRAKESLQSWGDEARLAASAPALSKLGEDVSASADRVRAAFEALPTNVPINVEAPGGQEVYDLLQQLGVQVNTNNDKQITVDAPMAPEVIETLKALGIEVTTNNDKTITVSQVGAEDAGQQIDAVASKDYTAVIRVLADTQAAAIDAGAALGVAPVTPRADGAIVPMANGGLRMIDKPDQADIYAGAGAGTIFAEEETGGEAYIPLAPAKRSRSTAILAEVARLFGLQLSAPTGASGATVPAGGSGGDLVSALSQAVTAPIVSALDGIRAALSSRSAYSGSSPMPVRLAGSGFDSALLAKVPSGVYSQTQAADLTQGLADCSSAVEDLVNLMDGMPTAGREMSTGNAAEWLTSRGFLPTDTPVPGTFQVGFNDRHMEATLPGGTKFNWGGDASAASGGTSGASGAWDPAFTQHYYRAVSALDENTAAWSTLTATTGDLNTALENRTSAETDMADAVGGQADVVTQIDQAANQSQPGGMDGSSLGQSIVGGLLQGIGLDGSVFSNPFEWANVKSGMALANWGGGLLQGLLGGSADAGAGPSSELTGGGGFAIPGIPNIADMIKPLPAGTMTPQSPTQHQGGGQPPGSAGPSVVVNGNVGMDPRSFTQRIDAHQNQAYRRNLNAVRPG